MNELTNLMYQYNVDIFLGVFVAPFIFAGLICNKLDEIKERKEARNLRIQEEIARHKKWENIKTAMEEMDRAA